MPQEKLAYLREFSLVKLLKSPLNLLFDESINDYKRERRKGNSKRITWFANHSWRWIDRMETKERVLAEMDLSVSITSRCCELDHAVFYHSVPLTNVIWSDNTIDRCTLLQFFKSTQRSSPRAPSVSFPVHVLEVRINMHAVSQFKKKKN